MNNIGYQAILRLFIILDDKSQKQSFFFWYGGTEPHRRYEYGSGVAKGEKWLEDIDRIPAMFPDNDSVRNDFLDYAFEIEYFDIHLARMLETLQKSGELENTVVIVTADNGMPFPKIKGQVYEMSNHLPLAIMWGNGIKNARKKVDDYVNFIDFTPTFLELANLSAPEAGMQPVQGVSLTDIFFSDQTGQVVPSRDHVLVGKERHDVGRPHDWGYPVRGIVKDEYLYLRNFETERWPAGNPETGYLNTDGGMTKTWILNDRRVKGNSKYWDWAFGKRPAEELYHISSDPECIMNLADREDRREIKNRLKKQMEQELKEQGDPRIIGNGHVFDEYVYMDKNTQNFYERFMAGEDIKAGWVNEDDFEKETLE